MAQRNFGKLLDSGDLDLLEALDELVDSEETTGAMPPPPPAAAGIPPVPAASQHGKTHESLDVVVAAGSPNNGPFHPDS